MRGVLDMFRTGGSLTFGKRGRQQFSKLEKKSEQRHLMANEQRHPYRLRRLDVSGQQTMTADPASSAASAAVNATLVCHVCVNLLMCWCCRTGFCLVVIIRNLIAVRWFFKIVTGPRIRLGQIHSITNDVDTNPKSDASSQHSIQHPS